jgi:hypothetical protein
MKKEFEIQFEPGQRVYQYDIDGGDFTVLSRKIESVIVEMRESRVHTKYVIRGSECKVDTLYETLDLAHRDAVAKLTAKRLGADAEDGYEDDDDDEDEDEDEDEDWGGQHIDKNGIRTSAPEPPKKKSKPKKKKGIYQTIRQRRKALDGNGMEDDL